MAWVFSVQCNKSFERRKYSMIGLRVQEEKINWNNLVFVYPELTVIFYFDLSLFLVLFFYFLIRILR